MKLSNAVKKLSKYGEVKRDETGKYWVIIGSYEVSFRRNGSEADPSITCEKTRPLNDHDELESDYHAGCFWDNLTQAVDYAEKRS